MSSYASHIGLWRGADDTEKLTKMGHSYSYGFETQWTNDGPNEFAAWRVEQGFPKDGFFADGYLGQRIYIVPSEHIVITCFGYSRPDTTGMQEEDDYALMADVIRTTRGSQRQGSD
jgi:hypothetical protein